MKKWIIGVTLFLMTIWLISLPEETLDNINSFWRFRKQFVLFIGFIAYLLMAWMMLLALRLPALEKVWGGLDRMYQLHKWGGITATVFMVIHWIMATVPKVFEEWGWIASPPRRKRLLEDPDLFNWGHLTNDIAEFSIYVAVALILISLLKQVPYHIFRRTHKVFALFFLAIAFHVVMAMPPELWLTPAGILMTIATFIGVITALLSLFCKIGARRQHQAIVNKVKRLSTELLEISCTITGNGMQYQPGQFAFARFAGTKDPHPLSISHSGQQTNKISFFVKVLGDDTHYLMDTLEVGSPVTIEGPYGKFTFQQPMEQLQIWVAGGVGIAPFLAKLRQRLEQLTDNPEQLQQAIHMYYCSRQNNPILPELAELCRQANVHLIVYERAQLGNLQIDYILEHSAVTSPAHIWYCGPEKLANDLLMGWKKQGFSEQSFHQEYFHIR